MLKQLQACRPSEQPKYGNFVLWCLPNAMKDGALLPYKRGCVLRAHLFVLFSWSFAVAPGPPQWTPIPSLMLSQMTDHNFFRSVSAGLSIQRTYVIGPSACSSFCIMHVGWIPVEGEGVATGRGVEGGIGGWDAWRGTAQ